MRPRQTRDVPVVANASMSRGDAFVSAGSRAHGTRGYGDCTARRSCPKADSVLDEGRSTRAGKRASTSANSVAVRESRNRAARGEEWGPVIGRLHAAAVVG